MAAEFVVAVYAWNLNSPLSLIINATIIFKHPTIHQLLLLNLMVTAVCNLPVEKPGSSVEELQWATKTMQVRDEQPFWCQTWWNFDLVCYPNRYLYSIKVYGKIWWFGTMMIGIEELQAKPMVVGTYLEIISRWSQESVLVMLIVPRHHGTTIEVVILDI